MKIKVLKKDTELVVDYIREANVYLLRYEVLKYLSDKYDKNLFIFINTNNRKKKAPISNIEKMLDNLDTDYRIEPTEKKSRKLIDLSWIFNTKNKNKDMSENIVLIKLTSKSNLENLYDDLLQYYDYGIGCDPEKSLNEIFNIIKIDVSRALFNKDYFLSTLYDSIIFYRMRMDAPYDDVAELVGKL